MRDKQSERKTLIKEVTCLEAIIHHVDAEKMVQAFQDSIKLANEQIKETNRITFVKELMEEAV